MATVGYPTHANRVPTVAPGVLSYYPTTGDALRFWSLREDKNVHSEVPQGFPAHIDARMAWQGSDMEMQSDAWVVLLSEADVFALEGAMRDFRSTIKRLILPAAEQDANSSKIKLCIYPRLTRSAFACQTSLPSGWMTSRRSVTTGAAFV